MAMPTVSYDLSSSITSFSPEHLLQMECFQHTFWPEHPTQDELRPWESILRSQIFRQRYLYHCLSSLNYLYQYVSDGREKERRLVLANHNHLAASTLFRQSMIMVDRQNWAGALLFGLSTLVFQLGSQQLYDDSAFDCFDTFRVFRFSQHIVTAAKGYLQQSEPWLRIQQRNLASIQPVDETLLYSLSDLQDSINLSEESWRCTLSQAMNALKQWVWECSAVPRNWKDYVAFPSMVSDQYLEALHGKNDHALLLLIYWCAIMYRGPKKWFLQRWLERTVSFAVSQLKNDWNTMLQWPTLAMSQTYTWSA